MKKYMFTGLLCMFLGLNGCAGSTGDSSVSVSAGSSETEETEIFYEVDHDQALAILEHGTAVIFFREANDAWDDAYQAVLEDALAEVNIQCAVYEMKDSSDHEDSSLTEVLAVFMASEASGYIPDPLTVFVNGGEIIANNQETADHHGSAGDPDTYWTDERKEALKEKLNSYMEVIAKAQSELGNDGCDRQKACTYGG